MNRRPARELWKTPQTPWEYKGDFDVVGNAKDRKWYQTMREASGDGKVDAEFRPVLHAGMASHIYQRDYDDYMAGDEAAKERMRLYQGIDDKTMVGFLDRKRQEAKTEFHQKLFAYHDAVHAENEEAKERERNRKREIRDTWLPAAREQYHFNMEDARYDEFGRHEVFGTFREDVTQDFLRKRRALIVDSDDEQDFEEMQISDED